MQNRGGYTQHRNRTQYQYHTLCAALFHRARELLEVILDNSSEESIRGYVNYVIGFRFQDGNNYPSDITDWLQPGVPEEQTKARMLEVLCHWIRDKARKLDQYVPLPMGGQAMREGLAVSLQDVKRRLELSNLESSANEAIAEFISAVVEALLGPEAACFGSVLAGSIINQVEKDTFSFDLDWPPALLAEMVRMLEEIGAKVSKVAMQMYAATRVFKFDDAKNLMMRFFQYYTVETTTGTLDVHETSEDIAFVESPFRVHLIDTFGALMKLLLHLEEICGENSALAVDFEGVKLCRHGALCLVQMTCYDDPRLVYVLDVHVLGFRAFTMQTPNGTSMKGVLENQSIHKVWFDPRNDVDALFHQFGIMPKGIFDLQLAEVADRRNRGLNVWYVAGLHKCLTQCPALQQEQKMFAENINTLGKGLFEPDYGGRHEIFQERPLNPVILVYSAHDSRYMFVLYEQYVQSIGPEWVKRVLNASQLRGRWGMSHEYILPSSEAPDF